MYNFYDCDCDFDDDGFYVSDYDDYDDGYYYDDNDDYMAQISRSFLGRIFGGPKPAAPQLPPHLPPHTPPIGGPGSGVPTYLGGGAAAGGAAAAGGGAAAAARPSFFRSFRESIPAAVAFGVIPALFAPLLTPLIQGLQGGNPQQVQQVLQQVPPDQQQALLRAAQMGFQQSPQLPPGYGLPPGYPMGPVF